MPTEAVAVAAKADKHKIAVEQEIRQIGGLVDDKEFITG